MEAVITGGSHGIGLAIKKELEKMGYHVTSWSRSEGVDLMDEEVLMEKCFELDKFDILINCVGGMGTCGFEDSWICMKKNYGITLALTESYLNNKRSWGRVITISSIYGKEKGINPYFAAAKSAQIAYMKSLAGRHKGITFNTICPGHINVGNKFNDNPRFIGKPRDVACLVAFLCRHEADHINGATITVDGGESFSF